MKTLMLVLFAAINVVAGGRADGPGPALPDLANLDNCLPGRKGCVATVGGSDLAGPCTWGSKSSWLGPHLGPHPRGSVMRNVVPLVDELSAVTVPPCISTNAFTIGSPRPRPRRSNSQVPDR